MYSAGRCQRLCKGIMQLDVIVPTFNRHAMLKRTLNSLLEADLPSGLDVRVTVVDNNSKDQTRNVVEEYIKKVRRSPPLRI